MYKKLYVLLLIPYLLYGWGSDYMVAQSDTSSGLFYLYTAILDKDARQAIFAVRDGYPYYMDIYVEDSTWAGTFSRLSNSMPFNTRAYQLIPYYNIYDSTTYIVAYTPQSSYTNLYLLPFHWDYSWDPSEFVHIDNAPDDTILYPDFKALISNGQLYFFVSCVKHTATYDTVFIYTSQDKGNTWNKHYITYLWSNGNYKNLKIDVTLRNDTIFLFRAYTYTSNDTTYTVALKKYMYDPVADDFTFIYDYPSVSDSFVYGLDISTWSDRGILAFDANGAVKIVSFATDTDTITDPIDISSPASDEFLIGVVKGYQLQFPTTHTYFAIAYTPGIAFLPNTESIIYTETDDGISFTPQDTLNNNPSTLPVLVNYPGVIVTEPAVLYVDVDYHGSFPFYYWDNTTLYIDRSSTYSKVSEHKDSNFYSRAILTQGPVNLTLKVKNSKFLNINLYSSTGRLIRNVYKGNTTKELKLNFDISELHSGVYFIKDTKGTISPIRILKR